MLYDINIRGEIVYVNGKKSMEMYVYHDDVTIHTYREDMKLIISIKYKHIIVKYLLGSELNPVISPSIWVA
jgi:hypothetical protein